MTADHGEAPPTFPAFASQTNVRLTGRAHQPLSIPVDPRETLSAELCPSLLPCIDVNVYSLVSLLSVRASLCQERGGQRIPCGSPVLSFHHGGLGG